MPPLVNDFISGLYTSYNDDDKEIFKLLSPAPDDKIDQLLSLYPKSPKELVSLLKIVNGSISSSDANCGFWNFFQINPECDDEMGYHFCTIEEMLAYEAEGDYSWLNLCWDESSSWDKEDVMEMFDEEINPEALVRERILFADNDYSQLYIDFSPSELGTVGQVIAYVHDPDSYFLVAPSLFEFLKSHIDSNFEYLYCDEAITLNTPPSNLNNSQLDEKRLNDLINSLSSLHENSTSLTLSSSEPRKIPKNGITKLFAAIPRSITSLELHDHNFVDLIEAFSFLPTNLKLLNLADNTIGFMKGSELTELFLNIPSGVTSLYLNSNNLNQMSGDELAKAFEALPKNLISLDLSFNRIGQFFCSKLRQIFQAIPKSVTSLNLSGSDLYSRPGDELMYVLSIIPENVVSLNLSYNSLDTRRGDGLEEALKNIPTNVTQLDLSSNDF